MKRYIVAWMVTFAGCTNAPASSAPAHPPAQTPLSSVPAPLAVAPASQTRPHHTPAKRPEAASLEVISQGLQAADWMIRLSAVEALAALPSRFALPRLERALADAEEDVRATAIRSLQHQGTAHSRTLLRSVRDDATELLSLRVRAAAALTTPSTSCP